MPHGDCRMQDADAGGRLAGARLLKSPARGTRYLGSETCAAAPPGGVAWGQLNSTGVVGHGAAAVAASNAGIQQARSVGRLPGIAFERGPCFATGGSRPPLARSRRAGRRARLRRPLDSWRTADHEPPGRRQHRRASGIPPFAWNRRERPQRIRDRCRRSQLETPWTKAETTRVGDDGGAGRSNLEDAPALHLLNRRFSNSRQAGLNSTFLPASPRFSSTYAASQRLEITAVSRGFCKAQT